jgi:hypothetical protein
MIGFSIDLLDRNERLRSPAVHLYWRVSSELPNLQVYQQEKLPSQSAL